MNLDTLKKIKEPIFFVANDVSRGIGLENVLPNYHIVCLDDHPLIDSLEKSGVSVFSLERELREKNKIPRNSGVILNHPLVLRFIKERGEKPNIIFFKPQKRIETVAQRERFNLIGNSTEINQFFEDKVSFFKFCLKNGINVPEGEIANISKINYKEAVLKYGNILVIQFGRGWAGNSTFFIKSEDEFMSLKKRFEGFRARVGKYIDGITVLNNAVVFGEEVLVSKTALQIKPNSLLTSLEGGTGGRQWPSGIEEEQENEIKEITQKVGKLMVKSGYKGFFGLDFIIEEKTGKIFLSENNARLTASSSFYTKLELSEKIMPFLGYHLLSFLPQFESDFAKDAEREISGSEIVVRNTESSPVLVENEFAPGIYNYSLQLKRSDYFLNTNNKDDFWLSTAARGRIVNPEIELFKLQTKEKVADEKGNINKKFSLIISEIKNNLKTKKCDN